MYISAEVFDQRAYFIMLSRPRMISRLRLLPTAVRRRSERIEHTRHVYIAQWTTPIPESLHPTKQEISDQLEFRRRDP